MKRSSLVLSGLLLAVTCRAHDIITTNLTFTRDISRIFAVHCVSCHTAGTAIPLTTYEQARPWAVAIKEQVLSRSMPPWGAVKGFGDLSPDHGLSQEDILIIAAWVIGGAPQGNPQLLPSPASTVGVEHAKHLEDGPVIHTHVQLKEAFKAAGIRPIIDAPIESARVTARLPNGRIVPLIWLHHFDRKSPRSFTFRQAVELPAGTVVESSAPLRFALQTSVRAPSPGS